MSDDNSLTLELVLSYLDGTCDSATKARFQERLQDPESAESKALREISAIESSMLSPQALAITEELVKDKLELERLKPPIFREAR